MNRRSTASLAVAMGLITALGGCDTARQTFGLEKTPPDEFAVYSRAPLSLPPNFGLRPPEPGRARPQEVEARSRAQQAVLEAGGRGGVRAASAPPPGSSPGVEALLRRTGALEADPEIRSVVNRETTFLAAAETSFVDRMIFWRDPEPSGTVVDANREARRIRENQALGREVTEGQTPTIQRKRKGIFEGILD